MPISTIGRSALLLRGQLFTNRGSVCSRSAGQRYVPRIPSFIRSTSTCQFSTIHYSKSSSSLRAIVSPNFNFRKCFSTSIPHLHGELGTPKPGEELHVTFIDKEGDKHTFEVCEGDNLLDIAQGHDLEMEGACGGSAACSTCHVIVTDPKMYDKLPEPTDDEDDMLDLAFGLTQTSRLGCQVKMAKDIDGLEVKLPSMTRNLQSSDFSKK